MTVCKYKIFLENSAANLCMNSCDWTYLPCIGFLSISFPSKPHIMLRTFEIS